ncbi:MAG: cell division protein ZapA [Gammaproteobacteria bacterium]|jgi:cell division protein ZapA|nr:cell division protein ZapA [Gammaproteobacteria bacterium]
MSIGENGFCVRILEKEFRVACPKNQEVALREAAQYLDKQMRLIRQSGRVIGLERIAVMAALNISNELLSLKNTAFEPDEAFAERLKLLQEKIDNVLARESLSKEQSGVNLRNDRFDSIEIDEAAELEILEETV